MEIHSDFEENKNTPTTSSSVTWQVERGFPVAPVIIPKNNVCFDPIRNTFVSSLSQEKQSVLVSEFKRCIIHGQSLEDLDLRGLNLSKSVLGQGFSLCGADLSNLDLSGVNLSGNDLSRTQLCETQLVGADLSKVIFYKADLRGTEFYGTFFYGASFMESLMDNTTMICMIDKNNRLIGRAPLSYALEDKRTVWFQHIYNKPHDKSSIFTKFINVPISYKIPYEIRYMSILNSIASIPYVKIRVSAMEQIAKAILAYGKNSREIINDLEISLIDVLFLLPGSTVYRDSSRTDNSSLRKLADLLLAEVS